jgi:hypothetical protein
MVLPDGPIAECASAWMSRCGSNVRSGILRR